jgi:DNA-binding CsgD family transcriptional regulator
MYNYFEYLQKNEQLHAHFDLTEINGLIFHLNAINKFCSLPLPVVYLLDYTQKEYAAISEGVRYLFGYTSKEWLDGGLSMFLNLYHPKDFDIFSTRIFKENAAFIQQNKAGNFNRYIFSHNYRVKNSVGKYVSILQKNILLGATAEGLPLYSLGMVSVIDNPSAGNKIIHRIEENNGVQLFTPEKLICTNSYYPEEQQNILTKREIETIKWMTEGFGSKQIADKMNISELTVKKHRSNIFTKTLCKNSNEVMMYAVKEKII